MVKGLSSKWPSKSAENSWQILELCSSRSPLCGCLILVDSLVLVMAHETKRRFIHRLRLCILMSYKDLRVALLAIGERHLPIESSIASRSTDVMMTTPNQTINNLSIKSIIEKEKLNGNNLLDWYRNLMIFFKSKQKLNHQEEALPEAPHTTVIVVVRNTYTRRFNEQQEAEQELSETVKAFHACKQEEGQSISTYVLKMKGYIDQMECLGYLMPQVLGVSLILTLLFKDYEQFFQNNNMHIMGKTIPELHGILELA
ncbi:hypothetical protein Tco_0525676 [Tanacetum coccineum]